jgi:hypothetical protein
MLHFLKNKVLNNGIGYVPGGSFVGQPFPSRMEVGLPIDISMGTKRMDFSKPSRS